MIVIARLMTALVCANAARACRVALRSFRAGAWIRISSARSCQVNTNSGTSTTNTDSRSSNNVRKLDTRANGSNNTSVLPDLQTYKRAASDISSSTVNIDETSNSSNNNKTNRETNIETSVCTLRRQVVQAKAVTAASRVVPVAVAANKRRRIARISRSNFYADSVLHNY